jgi:hypothetical protein
MAAATPPWRDDLVGCADSAGQRIVSDIFRSELSAANVQIGAYIFERKREPKE